MEPQVVTRCINVLIWLSPLGAGNLVWETLRMSAVISILSIVILLLPLALLMLVPNLLHLF